MTKKRLAVICWAAGLGALALDLWTKALFFRAPLKLGWPGVMETIQHRNYGAVGNIAIPQPALLAISGVISLIILWLLLRDKKPSLGRRLALAIVLGGAMGNFWDRLTLGYVRDWILILNTSVLNIADIAISLGIIWYLLSKWRRESLDLTTNAKQDSSN